MLNQWELIKPSKKMGGFGFILTEQQGQPCPAVCGRGSVPLEATAGGPSTALLSSKAGDGVRLQAGPLPT